MDGRCYLIVKRDLYYRPDAAGYTGIKDHAGRYTLAEARSRANDEVSFVHEDEAPDYTKACFHDLKAEHLEGKLKAAETRADRLAALLKDAEEIVDVALFTKADAERARDFMARLAAEREAQP